METERQRGETERGREARTRLCIHTGRAQCCPLGRQAPCACVCACMRVCVHAYVHPYMQVRTCMQQMRACMRGLHVWATRRSCVHTTGSIFFSRLTAWFFHKLWRTRNHAHIYACVHARTHACTHARLVEFVSLAEDKSVLESKKKDKSIVQSGRYRAMPCSHACGCTRRRVCAHACICTWLCVRTHACLHGCVCARMHAYMGGCE